MAEATPNQIDAFTNKYQEGFEKFSSSKSGNIVIDFILFKRNIVPYTLQIVFILGISIMWVVAVLGLFAEGPIGDVGLPFLPRVGVCLGVFALGPFVLHYLLELAKILWRFVAHVYEKVLIPIWNTLVLRFLANVAPQILPFLYERIMKFVDICISKVDPLLDAAIGILVSASMTLVLVMKGIVWLPKKLGQWLGRVLDRSANGPAAK